jgi:hypothetical protein
MTTAVYIYIVYTVLSIMMTAWVAHTLYKNGRVFLLEAFKGKEEMADSVNRLLVVGFYLVNLGFILLYLRYGTKPTDIENGVEYAATKLGVVLLSSARCTFLTCTTSTGCGKKVTITKAKYHHC